MDDMRPDTGAVRGSGERRSTADPKSGVISGATLRPTDVRYALIDGEAIFEGDIVLGTADELARSSKDAPLPMNAKGSAIKGVKYRWPEKLVPYQISTSLPNPERVRDAIRHWEENTDIRFVELKGANATKHKSWVTFRTGGGCSSSVGMQGGEQFITLGPSCTTGNAIHEIGHTVGLWHEQSRKDRDQHVVIHPENILVGFEHNFDQHITDGDDVGDYEFGSIMHYPRDAFSSNGQYTIEPKDKSKDIGQRKGLSAGDVAAVKAIYAASSAPPTVP